MTERSARQFAEELVNRRGDINRELSRNGVRFGVYKNGEYHDRLFPYDPIPRIIESDEFDELEAGLKQRVNALNAYLKDIYSDKRIIHDGVIPEEYVYTSAGYFPQVNGVTPPGGIFAHIAGEDLVQGEDGRWWVLEDNLRIPSGASYPLFARDIERRTNPKLFRDVHVRDNRDYPRLLRKAMDFVSTEGIAVVLTPGRYNSAFFEHAYLAEKTGAALAFPEDLEVVDNKLYFLDYAGNRHRVGAVYRRLSDEYLDPFAFNPDSVIGVPGLLSAYRSGNVAIINAPGNGAADDKAIYYFVPQMVRYYLNEEPILHNAPTYMPMFEKDRKEVLDRMGELVIKDVAEAGGYGVVFGSSLDEAAREDLADRIKEDPRRFIAQEVIRDRPGQWRGEPAQVRSARIRGHRAEHARVVFRLDALLVSARPDDRQLVAGRRIQGYVGAGARRRQHGQAARGVGRLGEPHSAFEAALAVAGHRVEGRQPVLARAVHRARVHDTRAVLPLLRPRDGHRCGRVPPVREGARPTAGFRGLRRVREQLPV